MRGKRQLSMTINHARHAFGIEGHEIQRRSPPASCVISSGTAMTLKALKEIVVLADSHRPADASIGQRASNSMRGIVIELVVLLGCAFPVSKVRLMPNYPIPFVHLI